VKASPTSVIKTGETHPDFIHLNLFQSKWLWITHIVWMKKPVIWAWPMWCCQISFHYDHWFRHVWTNKINLPRCCVANGCSKWESKKCVELGLRFPPPLDLLLLPGLRCPPLLDHMLLPPSRGEKPELRMWDFTEGRQLCFIVQDLLLFYYLLQFHQERIHAVLHVKNCQISLRYKVSTPNCNISRSRIPTLSTKPDTACLQFGH
jgi:hypothetical protein